MEEEMKPYYGPGYSGNKSIKTIMLSGGKQKHTMKGWIGYTNPNEGLNKAKWYRTDFTYHTINGYSVTEDNTGKISCNCKGFYFRKDCKHIKEVATLIKNENSQRTRLRRVKQNGGKRVVDQSSHSVTNCYN